MSRILFTSTLGKSAWAGSEVLWFQAAKQLTASGHGVAAVLPPQMYTTANRERLALAGIQLLRHPLDSSGSVAVRLARRFRPIAPAPFAPVARHARRWKADLVVLSQASCWGAYTEMLSLARDKIPYISISQLNTPYSWPGDSAFAAVGDAFALAKKCVFVSQGNLELFQNQVARQLDNAVVIYNPPSFDVSTPCSPPASEGFRLLNVARISPGHKGQDILIDVLSMPKWKSREVTLEIAGNGDKRWIDSLLKSKRVDSVRLLGHVTDLKSLWESATFGIFPSRQEGMPLALVEGMALGRPVIATDVAGHREWIDHGINGFLAAGTTATSLDEAMENAWEKRHLVADLGNNARQTFGRRLSIDSAATLAETITNV